MPAPNAREPGKSNVGTTARARSGSGKASVAKGNVAKGKVGKANVRTSGTSTHGTNAHSPDFDALPGADGKTALTPMTATNTQTTTNTALPPKADAPPLPNQPLIVLQKRSDFLAAARARRQGGGSLMVQARRRHDSEADRVSQTAIRVGFTCSKKVGNAVMRNRAKRRLREIARAVLPDLGQPGWDYVLIGRAETTIARDFVGLTQDFRQAMRRLHAPQKPGQNAAKSNHAKRPDRKPEPQSASPDRASKP